MPTDPQPVAWALYEDGDMYDAVTQEEDAVAWRNRVPPSVATRTICPLYAAPPQAPVTVTDGMVEAGARSMYAAAVVAPSWERSEDDVRDVYRAWSRACLTAAFAAHVENAPANRHTAPDVSKSAAGITAEQRVVAAAVRLAACYGTGPYVLASAWADALDDVLDAVRALGRGEA